MDTLFLFLMLGGVLSVFTTENNICWKLITYDLYYDYTLRNIFKGLDLMERVPDEQWTEVHGIVQETGIKTILMEKKCKKAKLLSEEALQKAMKRREVKSKGEKEDIPIWMQSSKE